ncbi:MAG TPA: hypothetical protein VNS22_27660 [Geminicoccus sp.]|uniref:hypothetical protein n=1 Tax=Geminicoccus sp. TaxID=2024832 RepID=UPI002C926DDB|nr:hypothetical protein [Geminicoccus sp.]HWL72137.1 hypothetical protein [Geminicoccus sp.]
MAETLMGQESAPRLDSQKTPASSSSTAVTEVTDRSPAPTTRDLWLMVHWLAEGDPVPLGIVQMIADGNIAAHRRKRILMALHGRGLIDDRLLRTAFEYHPELAGA